MRKQVFFTDIPVIFTTHDITKSQVSFTNIPVIFVGDIRYGENVGLDTKEERQQFIDWYYDTYRSYIESIKKKVIEEEGIDEDKWEDYKWELDVPNFYFDFVDMSIINLPKGKLKFKILKPGTRIYRTNLSKHLPQKYNLWFFPEDYSPPFGTLESYKLFSENSYLLELEVVEPLVLVDMNDLDTILRLMMDKRYYKQEVSDVPFALAMSYAFLGYSELHRTSSYTYDLPITSVLCQVQGFDGFISTTQPQHPEIVVCSKTLDKIRVINSVKGTRIEEMWYPKIIRQHIEKLKKGDEKWKWYIEDLEEILKKRDFDAYGDIRDTRLSFQELMAFK